MENRTRLGALPGSSGVHHPLNLLTDPNENYGARVIDRFVRKLKPLTTAVDLGAGNARDLNIVRRYHPQAKLIAVESGIEYARQLEGKVDQVHVANIERDRLPLPDESVDLFIANQVLEHTKEIFWIFHEASRCLKVGGHFLIGVPNVCSLHNRILVAVGKQPSSNRTFSAHVRPFSKGDVIDFLDICFPNGYSLSAFGGAQFYPFPLPIARLLADTFPSLAVSIFFNIRKLRQYGGEFARYPIQAKLETNYWCGDSARDSQYWESTSSDVI